MPLSKPEQGTVLLLLYLTKSMKTNPASIYWSKAWHYFWEDEWNLWIFKGEEYQDLIIHWYESMCFHVAPFPSWCYWLILFFLFAEQLFSLLSQGVHLNICVFWYRQSSLIQMIQWGFKSILVRDVTDALSETVNKDTQHYEKNNRCCVCMLASCAAILAWH